MGFKLNELTDEEVTYLTKQLTYFREQKEREKETRRFDMTRFYFYSEDLELCCETGYGEKYKDDIMYSSSNDDEENYCIPKEIIYDIDSHDTLAPIDSTYQIMKFPNLFVVGKNFIKKDLTNIKNKLLEMKISAFKCEQEEAQKKIDLLEEKINKAKSLIKTEEDSK